MRYVCFLIIFLLARPVYSLDHNYSDLVKLQRVFVEESLGVVEVIGQYKGSGFPVVIKGRPYIITNSHVLGNKSTADIVISKQTVHSFSTCLKAEQRYDNQATLERRGLFGPLPTSELILIKDAASDFRSPSADIVVLRVPSDTSEEVNNLLKSMGVRNIQFFEPTEKSPYGFSVSFWPSLFQTGLSNIIHGKSNFIKLMDKGLPIYTGDRYISGLYRRIMVIGAFAYPGLSGGVFYHHGELRGMLTKVSLGVTPEAYFIPVEEIARIILQVPHYYGKVISNSLMKTVDEQFYDFELGDRIREVKLEKKFYIKESGHLQDFAEKDYEVNQSLIGDGGGEIGNGGGEIGNGSGKTNNGNSNLWKFKVFTRLDNGKTSFKTFNPFKIVDHPHEQSRVIYIEKLTPKNRDIYYGSTIAMRNWLENVNNSRLFMKIKWGYRPQEDLQKQREINASINYPKYVRWYKKVQENEFEALMRHYHAISRDGAQALFPEGRVYWKTDNIFKVLHLDDHSNKVDEEGYFQLHPFMARRPKYSFLDVKNSEFGNFIDPSKQRSLSTVLRIQILKDLAKINLELGGETIVLNQVSKDVTYKSIFQSVDKSYRGIILFNSENIAVVDRIFIETPDYLFEFLTCSPGETCIR